MKLFSVFFFHNEIRRQLLQIILKKKAVTISGNGFLSCVVFEYIKV